MDCVTGFEKTAKIRQESRSQEHELETNAGRSGADLASFERSGLAGLNLEKLLKKYGASCTLHIRVITHKPRCVHFMSPNSVEEVRKYGCQEGGSSRPGSFYAPCSAGNGGKNSSRHEDRGMRRLAPFLPSWMWRCISGGCASRSSNCSLLSVDRIKSTVRCSFIQVVPPSPSSMKNISLPRFRSADRR